MPLRLELSFSWLRERSGLVGRVSKPRSSSTSRACRMDESRQASMQNVDKTNLDASNTDEDVQSTGSARTSSRTDSDIEHVVWKSQTSSTSRTDGPDESMFESRRRTGWDHPARREILREKETTSCVGLTLRSLCQPVTGLNSCFTGKWRTRRAERDESSQHFSSPWFGRHHLRAVDINNDLVYNGLRSRLVSPVDES